MGDQLMRLLIGRPRTLFILSLALCASALIGSDFFTGHAQQSRSITDGVYTAAQATRGEQIYKAQCAECHGDVLQGAAGPPLVGEGFLANWSAKSLASVVDKTQKTMPFTAPNSLTRQQ